MSEWLTDDEHDMLRQLDGGPRFGFGISSLRVLTSLERAGLASMRTADCQLWASITPAGRALLPRPLQQEEKT